MLGGIFVFRIGMRAGETQRKSQTVGGLRPAGEAEMQQVGQLQKRHLNSEQESENKFKCIHLEQIQHCLDLPLQIILPTHRKQVKMGPVFGWTLPLCRR